MSKAIRNKNMNNLTNNGKPHQHGIIAVSVCKKGTTSQCLACLLPVDSGHET